MHGDPCPTDLSRAVDAVLVSNRQSIVILVDPATGVAEVGTILEPEAVVKICQTLADALRATLEQMAAKGQSFTMNPNLN